MIFDVFPTAKYDRDFDAHTCMLVPFAALNYQDSDVLSGSQHDAVGRRLAASLQGPSGTDCRGRKAHRGLAAIRWCSHMPRLCED